MQKSETYIQFADSILHSQCTKPMPLRSVSLLLLFISVSLPSSLGQDILSIDQPTALHRGIYEATFHFVGNSANPYYDITFVATFVRPDGSKVTAEGFFDGGNVFKVRAYCDMIGSWQWETSSSHKSLDGRRGAFEVVASHLKGKLRQHPEDPYQFAYDNGEWFLHIGDTGYRFLVASEPHWQAYIDQAAEMGASKIRSWFAQDRGKVDALFAANGRDLALFYWKEIEKRILYTLHHHPGLILQLIPYAEDTERIRAYQEGEKSAQMIARYAQARWSSFPNVQWTITNDRQIVRHDSLSGRQVHYHTIDMIGKDMAEREPWGTLLTNHQSRFSGYDHVDEAWSDIISLEDLDQVDGRLILSYRKLTQHPIVLDEDRYELYRYPAHSRYYFRRLMWASLLSGGHATYGGLKTYLPYRGQNYRGPNMEAEIDYSPHQGYDQGVSGYFDANRRGMLQQGGHDFRHIHTFFESTGLSLVQLQPDDALAGDDPLHWKCMHNDRTYLLYLSNPSGSDPGSDYPRQEVPGVSLSLPVGSYQLRWFDPDAGSWSRDMEVEGGKSLSLSAPGGGDWVLLIEKERNQ